ncbi:MAG: bifunctional adenosylcobinamide kinase/adenosylcobinamide-phosphate guanylyltransferase [Candidatus Omnitrophota bacterium]
MKKVILILGGARSGKSGYAVRLAKKFSKRVVFIATATSPDEEMKERIKMHKSLRPRQWKVIEEGKDFSAILSKLKGKCEVVLIDCLGLLVSNLLADNLKDKEIIAKIKGLINSILKAGLTTISVSNEVGSGIVPNNPLARRFRDLAGLTNQMFAKKADEVIFMQAGIPMRIKGEEKDAKFK